MLNGSTNKDLYLLPHAKPFTLPSHDQSMTCSNYYYSLLFIQPIDNNISALLFFSLSDLLRRREYQDISIDLPPSPRGKKIIIQSTPQKKKAKMQAINFITGNENKLVEVRAILGDTVTVNSKAVDVPEIQGTSEEIAIEKCRRAADEVS